MKKIKITEEQLKRLIETRKEIKEDLGQQEESIGDGDGQQEETVEDQQEELIGDGDGQQEENVSLNEQKEKILKEFKRYL